MRKELYTQINILKTTEQPLYDAEKERIMEHLKKEIRPKSRFSAVFKILGTAAACFALLVTASVYNPVLAESIPFMNSIVSLLKHEKLPLNNVIAETNIENYMQPVDSTKSNMQITEAYCDGTALVLTTALELPGTEENILRIDPAVTVDINGESFITEKLIGMFRFYRTEGDQFAGSLALDISSLNLKDDFTLTLTVNSLTGIDPKQMILDMESGGTTYVEKSYVLDNTTQPSTISVPVDTAIRREYTVEKSVEDFTVHSVVTTPISTYLALNQQPEQGHFYAYSLTTEDGIVLSVGKFDNAADIADPHNVNPNYQPVPEGTEKLIFTIYAWDNRTDPLGIIEVPVDGGYKVIEEPYTVQHFSEDEITYDPPLENTAKAATLYELGETITSQNGREPSANGLGYMNPDATAEITYSNIQVYSSPAELGLTLTNLSSMFADQPLEQEGMKFVTFDVTLNTNGIYGVRSGDEQIQNEISLYKKNDGTAGILWINNYAQPEALIESDDFVSELAYFSGHMNGVTNYYHFASNANDSHEFVIGFYVPDELLASGNWRIGVKTGEEINGSPEMVYYSVPSVDLKH